jgi:hypothetical protein
MSTGVGFVTSGVYGNKGFSGLYMGKFSYSLQWVIGAAGRLRSSSQDSKFLDTQEIPIHSFGHLSDVLVQGLICANHRCCV